MKEDGDKVIPGLRILAQVEQAVRERLNTAVNEQPGRVVLTPSLPPTLDQKERKPYFTYNS